MWKAKYRMVRKVRHRVVKKRVVQGSTASGMIATNPFLLYTQPVLMAVVIK